MREAVKYNTRKVYDGVYIVESSASELSIKDEILPGGLQFIVRYGAIKYTKFTNGVDKFSDLPSTDINTGRNYLPTAPNTNLTTVTPVSSLIPRIGNYAGLAGINTPGQPQPINSAAIGLLMSVDVTGEGGQLVITRDGLGLYIRGESLSVFSQWFKVALVGRDSPVFGTFTISGSGQTTISIPHGLGLVPSYTNVVAKSAVARSANITSWTEDATNIVVTVSTPQSSGSMVYSWEAKI